MLKTSDGKKIKVGMWLQDATGIYEVVSITKAEIDMLEVWFTDNNGNYILTAERKLTPAEVCKMCAM